MDKEFQSLFFFSVVSIEGWIVLVYWSFLLLVLAFSVLFPVQTNLWNKGNQNHTSYLKYGSTMDLFSDKENFSGLVCLVGWLVLCLLLRASAACLPFFCSCKGNLIPNRHIQDWSHYNHLILANVHIGAYFWLLTLNACCWVNFIWLDVYSAA